MSGGLIFQWAVTILIIGWAVWFLGSRLGLFAFVMGSRRQPRAGAKCSGCEHCGPATGMQRMLEQMEEKTAGKM